MVLEDIEMPLYSEDCGFEFKDCSMLDINHCLVSGVVRSNSDQGYDVEIYSIKGIITKGLGATKEIVGHFDALKIISSVGIEDIKESLIEFILLKNNVGSHGEMPREILWS